MNKTDPNKSRVLREAERYHKYKNKITKLKSKFNTIKEHRKLAHLLLILFLCITYFVVFTFFRSDENIWFNLFQNLTLSTIAADIFYICTIIIPAEKNKKIAYEIITEKLNELLELFLNCMYSMLNNETILHIHESPEKNKTYSYNISWDSVRLVTQQLLDNSIWNKDYLTCDWEIIIARAQNRYPYTVDGYNKQAINIKTGKPESRASIIHSSSQQIKCNINNLLIKYARWIDFDYIQLLERVSANDLMFYLDSFYELNNNYRATYVSRCFKAILELYEKNQQLKDKYQRSSDKICNVLCKLPI